MPKIVSTTIFREHLSDVVKEVSRKEKYFLISKKGRPVSAIVNLDFFEDLLALSSPKYLKSIKRARKDYKEKHIFSHKDVFGAV